MNRSNPFRSQSRNSFNSRRGASRPQSRRHSSRNNESISRVNTYETDRFGSSTKRRGQRFDSNQRQFFEEDLSRDWDGRASYYQGSDDLGEGKRTSGPRRDDDYEDYRYSRWNRPQEDSSGRHFQPQRESFGHYDDPRNVSTRYSPMEDDRWQDDLDLDHAYEYRVEDHENDEQNYRRSPQRHYDTRSDQSRFSDRDQNYASHNRSKPRRPSSRRRRNDHYHS